VIVATAGHIDHGKTRLVKALTGVDTDRLPEERARGISIDLGFAHAALGAGGGRVSFIDVPGHERFIRNMLAGVCAIDAALLVVAADDGVMPQTLEHLHILDLLDVPRGAIVVTKTDLVPAERVAAVCGEVQAAIASTALAGAPAFPLSVASGEGLPALREWLLALATEEPPPSDDGRQFRLAVDRAFTIAGSGTVVTGTVHSGAVAVGDHLVVSPSGREVRVRGVQVQGVRAERALSAQRCALNLAGLAVEDIGRGDWVLHPAVHAPTTRIDVRLQVLAAEAAPLAHWTPVHLHLGTADVPARIAISAEGSMAPGAAGFAQLVLERPVPALHGDRFVIRDQSARRTVGGGVVLDPFAPKRQRRASLRTAELQVRQRPDPVHVLEGLLEITEGGVDLQQLWRNLNLVPERAAALLRETQAVVLGKDRPLGISRVAADLLGARVLSTLHAFHASHPQASGMEAAALRRAAAARLSAEAFQQFLRDLANRQAIVLSNDVVRMREHEATANAQDERLWSCVRQALLKAGVHAPLVAELAKALEVKEPVLRDFLHRKSRTGELMRVTTERFCLRETLAQLGATAVVVARSAEPGMFTAAQFRDAIGTGRGLAIHYLEFFDRLGITQRFGDQRRIGKDFATQLRPAEPLPATPPCKEPS
jgi:selenocysteine-specific elongation factor